MFCSFGSCAAREVEVFGDVPSFSEAKSENASGPFLLRLGAYFVIRDAWNFHDAPHIRTILSIIPSLSC